ncbi:MAG: hypothetical protein OSA51_13165 [Octadecabacter sp.]|nr:hypothetical protein [Octadecabacter sp.]
MTFIHTDIVPQIIQLDAVSKALLPVVRHFLDAFLRSDTQGWRYAFAAASGKWGEARGLSIAYDTQMFLETILRSRPVPLTYYDPLDIDLREHLTTDEVDVLSLLAAMRADKTSQAREILVRLTGGQIPPRIVEQGLSLAARLDPDTHKTRPPKRPQLKVVRS